MTRTQAGQRFYRVRMHRTSAQLPAPPCMATPKGGEALDARVAHQGRASSISAQPTYCTQGGGDQRSKGQGLTQRKCTQP